MDVAIKIVVSFFVILVVGGTIITISQNLLVDGRNTIEDLGLLDSSDKLIERPSFTLREILNLAEACFRNNEGLIREELCFILRTNDPTSITEEQLNQYIDTFPFIILSRDPIFSRTLYITYFNEEVIISD